MGRLTHSAPVWPISGSWCARRIDIGRSLPWNGQYSAHDFGGSTYSVAVGDRGRCRARGGLRNAPGGSDASAGGGILAAFIPIAVCFARGWRTRSPGSDAHPAAVPPRLSDHHDSLQRRVRFRKHHDRGNARRGGSGAAVRRQQPRHPHLHRRPGRHDDLELSRYDGSVRCEREPARRRDRGCRSRIRHHRRVVVRADRFGKRGCGSLQRARSRYGLPRIERDRAAEQRGELQLPDGCVGRLGVRAPARYTGRALPTECHCHGWGRLSGWSIRERRSSRLRTRYHAAPRADDHRTDGWGAAIDDGADDVLRYGRGRSVGQCLGWDVDRIDEGVLDHGEPGQLELSGRPARSRPVLTLRNCARRRG